MSEQKNSEKKRTDLSWDIYNTKKQKFRKRIEIRHLVSLPIN